MKHALPMILLASPALAHPGPLHSHANLTDWLVLAGIFAALVAPAAIRAVVARKRK